jgi:beta-phosphoglucomutase-like phosphatase (HAD superfamily)
MLSTLAERFGVRLEASVFIGDNVTDLEAGRDAGCNTILVGTGEGRRSAKRLGLPPFTDTVAMPVTCDRMNGLIAIAPNLDAAVAHFLAKHGQ